MWWSFWASDCSTGALGMLKRDESLPNIFDRAMKVSRPYSTSLIL
jgi:hypothetical protein